MTDIKLSYETFCHKKVLDADIILAIPKGKKCYVWFTTYNTKYICYIIELGQQGNVDRVHTLPVSFEKDLSYGSLFYGTMFLHNHKQFVVIEDVLYYRSKYVQRESYAHRLDILYELFTHKIKQLQLNKSPIFALPIMHSKHEEIVNLIPPNQRIMYFQYRYFHKNTICRVKTHVILKPNEQPVIREEHHKPVKNIMTKQPIVVKSHKAVLTTERVFYAQADIQNDIYHLYDTRNKYTGVAYIPDYKTSVMMNKLFRNIKENDNLDALEESDDEEEFEDERIDKHVNLDLKIQMVCAFHNKFKKWVPIRCQDRN